jgi:hypothetical protein
MAWFENQNPLRSGRVWGDLDLCPSVKVVEAPSRSCSTASAQNLHVNAREFHFSCGMKAPAGGSSVGTAVKAAKRG